MAKAKTMDFAELPLPSKFQSDVMGKIKIQLIIDKKIDVQAKCNCHAVTYRIDECI